MTIRSLAAVLFGLAVTACHDDPQTPSPIGTWGYADPTDRYAFALSLQGQEYTWLTLGLTVETNTFVEVHQGTFVVTAEGLVLSQNLSSCPEDRRNAVTFQMTQPDDETLTLVRQNDAFYFKRNHMSTGPQLGTQGCFADDGAFTAAPLVALP